MNRDEAIKYAAAVRAIPTLRSDLARLMADLDVKITLATYFDQRAGQLREEFQKSD